ncbi:hypothetical protein COC46_06205 [Bacillus sp. AFS041924]|nr:hypothetical protein COC46_06205 [Bacillus sp. AFS041924]
MQSKLKTNLGRDSDETYCFGLGRNYTKYELNCPIGGHNGTALYVNGKLIELNSLGRTQTQTFALEVE